MISYRYAGIAQLVERCLAKAKVAGSSPVSRSSLCLSESSDYAKTSVDCAKSTAMTGCVPPFKGLCIIIYLTKEPCAKSEASTKTITHIRKVRMKSIMEESSTVAKATEIAWKRAGNPQEFTVKVLEFPQTGFFGLKTIKSAKIALFFNERVQPSQPARAQVRPQRAPHNAAPNGQPYRDEQPRRNDSRPEARQPYRPVEQASRDQQPHREQQPYREQQPRRFDSRNQQGRQDSRPHYNRHEDRRDQSRENDHASRPVENRGYNEQAWNESMSHTAQDWIKDALQMLGHGSVQIAPHVSHNYLKIRLSDHVSTDPQQEEMLLKSWGSLAMEAVREKAQQPLRHLRVVVEGKR